MIQEANCKVSCLEGTPYALKPNKNTIEKPKRSGLLPQDKCQYRTHISENHIPLLIRHRAQQLEHLSASLISCSASDEGSAIPGETKQVKV
jgi:hypothetical protein